MYVNDGEGRCLDKKTYVPLLPLMLQCSHRPPEFARHHFISSQRLFSVDTMPLAIFRALQEIIPNYPDSKTQYLGIPIRMILT